MGLAPVPLSPLPELYHLSPWVMFAISAVTKLYQLGGFKSKCLSFRSSRAQKLSLDLIG